MVLSVDVSLSKVDNLGPKALAGVREYLETGADKGHAVASDKVPKDRGAGGGLLGQIFTPTWQGNRLVWGVRDAPHARPMEFGTAPFHPPVRPLVEWAERVAGDPGLGYYVALHKIPTEGIDAQPYMRPGRDAQESWYASHGVQRFLDRHVE